MTMQDRFKFKVYHKPTHKIYNVYGFNDDFVFTDTLDTCEPLKREDCILLQSTGLKDKNGKLIYEGDICIPAKDMADKAGEVYRAKCGAYFIKGRMKSGMEYDFSIYWHHYMYEVIGNIHENPDLLE